MTRPVPMPTTAWCPAGPVRAIALACWRRPSGRRSRRPHWRGAARFVQRGRGATCCPTRARPWCWPANASRRRSTPWRIGSMRRLGGAGGAYRCRPEPRCRSAARHRRAGRGDAGASQADTLLILGANPAYDAPADLRLRRGARRRRLQRAPRAARDETAALCTWHLPGAAPAGGMGRPARARRHGRHRPAADPAALRDALRRRAARRCCSGSSTSAAHARCARPGARDRAPADVRGLVAQQPARRRGAGQRRAAGHAARRRACRTLPAAPAPGRPRPWCCGPMPRPGTAASPTMPGCRNARGR